MRRATPSYHMPPKCHQRPTLLHLVFNAIVLPLVFPIALVFLGDVRGQPVRVSAILELLLLYIVVFVQFYTLVSMVATRREENVLKRLRTGETSNLEIILAMAMPGVILTVLLSSIMTVILFLAGAPAPVNPFFVIYAFFGGVIIFTALAFATSAFTKNAEAAQITCLPVFTLAALGMSSLSSVIPNGILSTIVSWTPTAALSELLYWGWAGVSVNDSDHSNPFGHIIQPSLVLMSWTLLSIILATMYFRWESRP